MEETLEYMRELRENFLNMCNKPFSKEEYYRVVMDARYDSYDHFYSSTTKLYIEEPQMVTYQKEGFLGFPRTVTMQSTRREWVGIYAVKKKNGIYEMVTGKELTVTSKNDNSIYCMGIEKLSEPEMAEAGKHLKYLESNLDYKKQYINRLQELSEEAYKKTTAYEAASAKKKSNEEASIQYLKSYRSPEK